MTPIAQPTRILYIIYHLRWWAIAGLLAAVCGIGGVAFLEPARSLTSQGVALRMCAAFGLIGVACLIVFIAGLRGYLDAQMPAGSLAGAVAQAGGLMTASLLAASYLLKVIVADNIANLNGDPDLALLNGLDGSSTGAWAGLAVTMLSVAVASLHNAALPRWLGWLSLAAGGLVAIASVAGAPPAGFLPGVAWLVVTGVAMARKG